jgi:fatty acid desaturase
MEHLPVEVMTVWAAAVAMGAWAWTLGAGVVEVKVVVLWVALLGLVAVAAKEAVRVLETLTELRWLEREAARQEAEAEAAEARATSEALAARVRLGGG